MALLWFEGFEDTLCEYPGRQVTSGSTGSQQISTLYGRFGGKGARMGDAANDHLMVPVQTASSATFVFGTAIKIPNSTVANGIIVTFYDPSDNIIGYLRHNITGGKIYYSQYDAATTAIVETNALLEDTWYYLELEVTMNDTTGAAEIKVDEASHDTATSTDTLPAAASASVAKMKFAGTSAADHDDIYFDDMYLLDNTTSYNNDFLGDVQVVALMPDGNGNYSNMTGSDGNQTDNYQLVDEDPPSTTDYVYSTTEGDEDTYTMEDLASTTVTVFGVEISVLATKDDAGTKYMRPILRSSSTDYYGPSTLLSASPDYTVHNKVYSTHPGSGILWTAAQVNAMEVGPEVRDS